MTDEVLLTTFVHGGRPAKDSKQPRALDSLCLRVLNLDPLLDPRFDRHLLRSHVTHAHKVLYNREKASLTLHKARRRDGDVRPGERDSAEMWLRQAVPEFRGSGTYGDGQFDQALQFYASEEKSLKFTVGVRLERGRIFGMPGEVDNAVAQFQLALTEMRSRDAYARALQEDVTFYPAHQRLGTLALGTHDTTTALRELDLVVQIARDEPFLRYLCGRALGAAGKYQESSDQLKKAVELEPYFALPLVTLGQVYEQLHDGKNAQAAYTPGCEHGFRLPLSPVRSCS